MPCQAKPLVASQGAAGGLFDRAGHDVQALGKMVIEKVSKGRCCEILLGGHQVGLLASLYWSLCLNTCRSGLACSVVRTRCEQQCEGVSEVKQAQI